MNFWIKERERITFLKLSLKDQHFLHSYIYDDSKNMYMLIKKMLNEKKKMSFW